jgi:hypothetical protein
MLLKCLLVIALGLVCLGCSSSTQLELSSSSLPNVYGDLKIFTLNVPLKGVLSPDVLYCLGNRTEPE